MDKREPRADATIQLDTSEMFDAIQLDTNDGDIQVTRRSDRPGPPPLPPGSASMPPPALHVASIAPPAPAGRSWKAYAIVGGLLVASIAIGIGVGGAMRAKAPPQEATKAPNAATPSSSGAAAPAGSAVIVIPTVDFNDTK